MNRTKSVITSVAYGGAACTADRHTTVCNIHACPVDAKVSGWTGYSSCTTTCGTGTKTKRRSVITTAAHGGVAASALSSTITSNLFSCPVDAKVSGWTGMGACSEKCGGGIHSKTRSIITPAAHGGISAPLSSPTTTATPTLPH